MSCPGLPYLTEPSLNDIMRYSFEDFLKPLADQLHSVPAEETREIDTDFTSNISSEIRRALVARYPLCLKLCDDFEDWDADRPTYIFEDVLNEPCVIAAAIALRPFQCWEWNLVKSWAWVYRHALTFPVPPDSFEKWCELRDPDTSREYMLSNLTWLYCKPKRGWAAVTALDIANGDASEQQRAPGTRGLSLCARHGA